MPTIGDVTVSIEVNKRPLKEYLVPTNQQGDTSDADDVARRWIESEAGKEFAIKIAKKQPMTAQYPDLSVVFLLDEYTLTSRATRTEGSESLNEEGVEVGSDSWDWYGPLWTTLADSYPPETKFAFAEVTVDDDPGKEEPSTRTKGTIIVLAQPGSYRPYPYNGAAVKVRKYAHKGPENDAKQQRNSEGFLVVTPAEKLKRDHCVYFKVPPSAEESETIEENSEESNQDLEPDLQDVQENNEDLQLDLEDEQEIEIESEDSSTAKPDTYFHPSGAIYTFIFHYNSFQQLQADGIIPSNEAIHDRNVELEDETRRLKAEIAKLRSELARPKQNEQPTVRKRGASELSDSSITEEPAKRRKPN